MALVFVHVEQNKMLLLKTMYASRVCWWRCVTQGRMMHTGMGRWWAVSPMFGMSSNVHRDALRINQSEFVGPGRIGDRRWLSKGPSKQEHTDPLHVSDPQPIRSEFLQTKKPLSTSDLEAIPVYLDAHREPQDVWDRIALRLVKLLRIPIDRFFAHRYYHRAVVLETVAGVPGMVGGMMRHLNSLRRLKHDGGWIAHLLHEAENERMHLMIWMKVCQPGLLERMFVVTAQGAFSIGFLLMYLMSRRLAHRFVGYLEEEAVVSYTRMLADIDQGKLPNRPAPEIAIKYYRLEPTATIRDVALAVRADEAHHRSVNHAMSDRIHVKKENLREPLTRVEQGVTTKVDKIE